MGQGEGSPVGVGGGFSGFSYLVSGVRNTGKKTPIHHPVSRLPVTWSVAYLLIL